MGVVREATQQALGRTVAVKSLRDGLEGTRATRHLLHEARVAGLLDHPNVLPVHDIVQDAEGRPHIIMQRVEGAPWSRWAKDPKGVRETFEARDPLVWNLTVLLQVANAVDYAHDRGILHRDLKLDNVMIGRFGEVLLLDWGIAVALDDRYGARIPLARDQARVAGTPRMMPPEMALGDGPAQGVHTDTYLLGGVLFQILAGRCPHVGDDVKSVLASIPHTVPEVPERVPAALARIVRRALAVDPAERYPDVASFRADVRAFLDHRGSVRLAARAHATLRRLHEAIEGAAERAEVYRLYDEARFGFEQALSEWSDNAVARDGLREARLTLARWEIAREAPLAAEALLEGVDEVPEDLLAALADAHARRHAAEAELGALREDADPGVGRRTRVFIIGLVGVLWILGPALFGTLRYVAVPTYLLGTSTVLLILVLGLGLWARDSLSRSRLNRASWGTILMLPIAQLVFDGTALLAGLDPEIPLALRPALWFGLVGMYTVTTLRRLWPVLLIYAPTAMIAGIFPAWSHWVLTAANFALLVTLMRLWWSPEILDRFRDLPAE